MDSTIGGGRTNGLGLLCGLALVVAAGGAGRAEAAAAVTPAQVVAWQEAGEPLLVIDVRPPHRFAQKHARGALSVPAFAVALKPLPPAQKVILYDDGAGSTESARAAEALEAKGHTRVHVLEGGLTAWEAAGSPMVAPAGESPMGFVEPVSVEQLETLLVDPTALHVIDLSPRRPAARGTAAAAAGRTETSSRPPARIPNARSAPSEASLQQQLAGLQPTDLIVLYDDGSGEAQRQAEQLRRRGFRAVKYLYGGMPAWQARQSAPGTTTQQVSE